KNCVCFWFLQGLCLSPAEVRLVGGSSPCSGRLEQQRQSDWEPVRDQNWDWNLTAADQVCRRISLCGHSTHFGCTGTEWLVSEISPNIEPSDLLSPPADSVRLENETHLCSGRLQVKWNQVWSSVCSDGFDLQDAEVVCRELGCGSPSGFEGKLYGEAPEWSTEFLCGGHESGLLHCDHSDRDTCSPGTTITLTCSVRLVEGSGRCDGTLELRNWGEWKPVEDPNWDLRSVSMVCRELDCGSPVSTRRRETGSIDTWGFEFRSNASSLIKYKTSSGIIELTCSGKTIKSQLYTLSTNVGMSWSRISSLDVVFPNIESSDLLSPPADSVRLVGGTHLCSGRLQVKWNQVWSSVCSDGFDLQDAEVVCRELGCGSPSGFEGKLYGEAPEWNTEFLCGGHESVPFCPDPDDVRLVGGASRCAGRLEVKHDGVWRAVNILHSDWNMKVAAVICGRLDCGAAVSAVNRPEYSQEDAWWISSSCLQTKLVSLWSRISSLDRIFPNIEPSDLLSPPADSVRLMGGTHLCSGRLQVKWNQVWSSVCSDGFDLQDAEVVCRELGCGSPSGFKGELYREAPEWNTEFLCGGHESGLLHCDHSDRDTCSPGTTITLTCSGKAAAGKRWNILSVKTDLNQMSKPPQLVPLEDEPRHPMEEAHFRRLYPRSHSLGYYPELMTIGEGWNVDGCSLFTKTVPYNAFITADAAPILLSISRSIFPLLMNKIPRYLNPFAWGSNHTPSVPHTPFVPPTEPLGGHGHRP
uniref:SRCR domain-containing protein n=1 Tax=Amphiprion percula TaxID=161767 RepID=A0A3P8TWM8_AMPPE